MTYAGVGVDYKAMDPFKRMAQLEGRKTAHNLGSFGFREVEASRGESVYLIETPDSYLAHVHEGLGTKNVVADKICSYTGKSYYDQIAQDTVAMIVNDMITLGALPLSVAMHIAVGDSNWFDDKARSQALVDGWRDACTLAHCTWSGGETPTLKGIVVPHTAELSGSAMGIIRPKERLISSRNIQNGDAIVLLGSSGIHANGLTLAREIAQKIPDGYQTKLSDGRSFGEALLDPTVIYVPLVESCLNAGIDIHYAINITGHGWRKLMRAPQPFVYYIEKIPEPQPVFTFIQEHGSVDDEEMYGTFNMGAGFALYLPKHQVAEVTGLAWAYNVSVLEAGHIKRIGDMKKVVIGPKDIKYPGETLGVR